MNSATGIGMMMIEEAASLPPPPPRGRLIVIEGQDCAGKTTLARRLEKQRGFIYVKSPDRTTPIGKVLDAFIKSDIEFSPDSFINERAAQMLFAAANLQARTRLMAYLESGLNVVMDRYVASGVVYHSVAQNRDESAFILGLNYQMPRPDLGFVLEVDPLVAANRRAEFGIERNDTLSIQEAVVAKFSELYGTSGGADDTPYLFVDASRSADDVFELVSAVLDEECLVPPPALRFF